MTINNQDHGRFTTPAEIRFQRLLPGPLERVWAYLTDPEKRGRWLAAGRMELRVGGAVTLEFDHARITPHREAIPEKYRESCGAGGEATRFTGRVLRCEPSHLLTHTWGEADGTESEVTYELSPQGEHVLLVLTHRKLGLDRDFINGAAAGWHTHLAILVARLEQAPVPPFWSVHQRLEREYAPVIDAALATTTAPRSP